MKIALLAPCEEATPPQRYGGIERCVYYLAHGLKRLGHEVTVFASGDSQLGPDIELVACSPQAIRKEPLIENLEVRLGFRYRALAQAIQELSTRKFDIIHNHLSWPLFFFKDLIRDPVVTTLHNLLDPPAPHSLATDSLCAQYPSMNYVSISDSQRKPQPQLNYLATVHHGIPVESFDFSAEPGKYLAFLGSFTPDKGAEFAIEIAKQTGKRLVIAAKQDPFHEPYFKSRIEPHLDGKQITYIGEVDHAQKVELLRNAQALLSPLQWDEPFGLVTIEALSCGTPVIALRRGALPEVLRDGQVGYLCDSIAEMAARVADIPKLSRQACRTYVEEHFTVEHMTKKYIDVYKEAVKRSRTPQ